MKEPGQWSGGWKGRLIMNVAIEKARHFLKHERAFRLGILPTETSHPKTAFLSSAIARSTAEGVRLLLQVDDDIPPAMDRVIGSAEFASLVQAMTETIGAGRRVFLTGCGATGRLAILLEAAWRAFWQELFAQQPRLRDCLPDPEETFVSVMAGGDYALIRSVEGFEDSTDLGRYQLAQAGVDAGDLVVAVTEGGETSFVIGTAWQGLDAGAKVFFVYNNPTAVLRQHVVRSREVIDEPRITKLDLFTGPMAIAGSTRMQATTSELLTLGAAMELSLLDLLGRWLPPETVQQLGLPVRHSQDYPQLFTELLEQIGLPCNIDALSGMVEWEESLYRNAGLVTYMTDRCLLDVLTDTTERTPTFHLPPFRKCDDAVSARSWAFVKNPRYGTREAWRQVLRREPRGIDWPASVYRSLNVAEELCEAPPSLNNSEIWKFLIGNERDPSRFESPDSGLVAILVGDEIAPSEWREAFDGAFFSHASSFAKTAALAIGKASVDGAHVQRVFHIDCELPASPLRLWERLATKLSLNVISTGTMARMGRVEGNYMSQVATNNKKLVDRGTRLVSQLAGVDYETACYALYEAIGAVSEQCKVARDAPSPVALAVASLRNTKHVASSGR
jgi:N-acetylmuramic acid 6-phosphate etherase